MILTAALFVSASIDGPTWIGEVKAFGVYLSNRVTTDERIGTIYVGRRTNADGSTVTLVRTVQTNNHRRVRLGAEGEGRIDRDSEGKATRITFSLQSETANANSSHSDFRLDPKTNVLVGTGSDGPFTVGGLRLPDRDEYLIDPSEALAFETPSPAALAEGWSLPMGTYGAIDRKAPSIGCQFVFRPSSPLALDLAGKREMFNVFTAWRVWTGSSIARQPEMAARVLFHGDGRLAAYLPFYGAESNPGRTTFVGTWSNLSQTDIAPPTQLRGELAELRKTAHQSLLIPPCGLVAPAPVRPEERTSVLRLLESATPESPDN